MKGEKSQVETIDTSNNVEGEDETADGKKTIL